MKRKFLVVLLSIVCGACLATGLSACGNNKTSDWQNGLYSVQTAYAEAQSYGYSGTLEEFIASISGTNGTNGTSISNVYLNEGDELVVTLSTGETFNLGDVSGEDGEDGADGSVWYTGSGSPSSTTGKDGDMYLDTTTYDIYQMASGSWSKVGNIKGEDGEDLTACTHTYGNWIVGEEATCTSMGYKYRTCSTCGDVDYQFTEALGHTYSDEAVYSAYYGHMLYCTTCKQIITEAHTFDENYHCETCGFYYYSEGLTFETTESSEGAITLSVSLGTCTDSNVVIPAIYNGYPVTGIADNAFSDYTELNSIFIPDSITYIGQHAFDSCTALTNITIPDSVTTVEYRAFANCTGLETISLPDSITFIGSSAFYNTAYFNNENNWANDVLYIGNYLIRAKTTAYGNYTISSGTRLIANYAFSTCSSLTNVVIPSGLIVIGRGAFNGCSALTNVTIPDSVTYIDDNAFYNCSLLSSIIIYNNVTYIGSSAFYGCAALTSITIPNGVTAIEDNTFYGCTTLASVTIPNSVTYIGQHAFDSCTALTSITIPDSVTTVEYRAFANCTGLETISLPDSITFIGSSAFYNTAYFNNESNWAEGVLYIGNYLIRANTGISGSYTISSETRLIANYAFSTCSALTDVVIPDGLIIIGRGAFNGCSALANVTIPDSVTYIDDNAFNNCSSLSEIKISSSVTYIGSSAFYGCDSLINVYYGGTTEEWGAVSIGENNTNLTSATIYYYSESQSTDSGNYWYYENGDIVAWTVE